MNKFFNKYLFFVCSVIMAMMIYFPSGESGIFNIAEMAMGAEITPQKPGGDGTAANPYEIGTAGELYWFAEEVNGGEAGINAVLTADIDLKSEKFTPIGNRTGTATTDIHNFEGSFDGRGHTITNLTINEDYMMTGLFGYVSGGEIKNLTVTNGSVTCKGNKPEEGYLTGGIAGVLNYGTISDCSYYGTVSGEKYVGGIVGRNQFGTISGCYSEGAVICTLESSYASGYAGGIAGDNYSTSGGGAALIENCHNKASVSGVGIIGGITGNNSDNCTIKDCVNEGSVNSTNSLAGGIVGNTTGELITGCVNYGDVTIDSTTASTDGGGIVGCITDKTLVTYCENYGAVYCYAQHVGGIAGGMQSLGKVTYCFNKGTVTAEGDSCNYVGGIVGTNSSSSSGIENCYNMGNVKAYTYVGGVVGYNWTPVKNCYNTALAEATKSRGYAGNIVGYSDTEILNCYYLDNGGEAVGNIYGSMNIEATLKSQEEFKRGEVAYLLQGDQTEDIWRQTIGTDDFPVIKAFSEDSLKVVELTATDSTVHYANEVEDGSIAVSGTGSQFNAVVNTNVYGGEGGKYLEALNIYGDNNALTDNSTAPMYYTYDEEDNNSAIFMFENESGTGAGIGVRAEVTTKSSAEADDVLYFVSQAVDLE